MASSFWKSLRKKLKAFRPKKLGWFWTILLSALFILTVYLARVYFLVTRDPGGKAAEIGQQCRETRQPNAGVPKIIHQIWLNDEEIPDRWKPPVKSCKDKNPEYEYKLWTLKDIEELIRKDYEWFLPTFQGYEFLMQKGDSARYPILHKYGGVYLDMDITCVVALDTVISTLDLTKTDAVASDVPGPGLLDTPILISKKGNPFMEFGMRKMAVLNQNYVLPFLTVYFSTGPYYLSLSYLLYPCRDTVLRMDTMYTRRLYFLHQQSASWQIWDYLIIKFFERVFLPLCAVIIIVKILVSQKTRIQYIFMSPQNLNNNRIKLF